MNRRSLLLGALCAPFARLAGKAAPTPAPDIQAMMERAIKATPPPTGLVEELLRAYPDVVRVKLTSFDE